MLWPLSTRMERVTNFRAYDENLVIEIVNFKNIKNAAVIPAFIKVYSVTKVLEKHFNAVLVAPFFLRELSDRVFNYSLDPFYFPSWCKFFLTQPSEMRFDIV